MTELEFFQMMNDIDEDLVWMADRPVPFRKKRGFKLMLIAAVLAFVLLLTPIAGAFALVVSIRAWQPDDPESGDAPNQSYKPSGLVGDVMDRFDWDVIKDAIEQNGYVDFGTVLDVLQNVETRPKLREGAFTAVLREDGTAGIISYTTDPNQTVIMIPEKIEGRTVTSIERKAFYENKHITHVSLPDTVTVIDVFAFHGCTNLLTVDLGYNLHTIGAYAFAQCTSLTGITLPHSLSKMGSNAFEDCKALNSVVIPSSLKDWENNTFYGSGLKEVTIENGVAEIPWRTFTGTQITQIEIPASVRTIGVAAFQDCESLHTIKLSEGLARIDSNAFGGTAIESLVIPSTVTGMGEIDFRKCVNLKKVLFLGDTPTLDTASYGIEHDMPDYTIYYLSGAFGFVEYQWDKMHPCRCLQDTMEQFVVDHTRETVPMGKVRMLGEIDGLVDVIDVLVIDNYALYQIYEGFFGPTTYDRAYFTDSALVLIKTKLAPNEQLLGLAGMVPKLYTVGGLYYLALYPVVITHSMSAAQDDTRNSFILVEVKRSDIRTDSVIRVGEVYAIDAITQGGSTYHQSFWDEYGK